MSALKDNINNLSDTGKVQLAHQLMCEVLNNLLKDGCEEVDDCGRSFKERFIQAQFDVWCMKCFMEDRSIKNETTE